MTLLLNECVDWARGRQRAPQVVGALAPVGDMDRDWTGQDKGAGCCHWRFGGESMMARRPCWAAPCVHWMVCYCCSKAPKRKVHPQLQTVRCHHTKRVRAVCTGTCLHMPHHHSRDTLPPTTTLYCTWLASNSSCAARGHTHRRQQIVHTARFARASHSLAIRSPCHCPPLHFEYFAATAAAARQPVISRGSVSPSLFSERSSTHGGASSIVLDMPTSIRHTLPEHSALAPPICGVWPTTRRLQRSFDREVSSKRVA